jgi:hypothetical protein
MRALEQIVAANARAAGREAAAAWADKNFAEWERICKTVDARDRTEFAEAYAEQRRADIEDAGTTR